MNVRMGWCPVIFQVVCMSTAFITVKWLNVINNALNDSDFEVTVNQPT